LIHFYKREKECYFWCCECLDYLIYA